MCVLFGAMETATLGYMVRIQSQDNNSKNNVNNRLLSALRWQWCRSTNFFCILMSAPKIWSPIWAKTRISYNLKSTPGTYCKSTHYAEALKYCHLHSLYPTIQTAVITPIGALSHNGTAMINKSTLTHTRTSLVLWSHSS